MSSHISNNSTCLSKNTKVSTIKQCKIYKSVPKKVIPSKRITCEGNENRSCSASDVHARKYPTRARSRSTKSEVRVSEKYQYNILDYCKNCGDTLIQQEQNANGIRDIDKLRTSMNVKSVRNDNAINQRNTPKPIQQYYKNENFRITAESVQFNDADPIKSSLDPIKEMPERQTISEESMFMIYSDSEDEVTYLDPDNVDNIEKLKEFRNKNYFECHSAKSRIKTRGNVTSLNNHKCVYRFYLNDRLFPVPLNSDYNNTIRCVECHLPMDFNRDSKDETIKGTIQAKVKLGAKTQDMVLLIPIKESLIISERRKEEKKIDNEYVYFGLVKLSADGNSMFNRTLPQDSLALKYQKGYKELQNNDRLKYKSVEENDVIII